MNHYWSNTKERWNKEKFGFNFFRLCKAFFFKRKKWKFNRFYWLGYTYAEKIEEKNGEEYKNCFYDMFSNFEKFVNSCWTRGKNKKSKNNCV